ncbi:MAG TPA: lipid biosynthesis B12-binding/radical SAM protein [bacterium]
MRVLLLSVNTVREPFPVYPLGLDYVAGSISARHEVRCLDLNCLGEDQALERAVAEWSPEVIGLSLRNADNTDSRAPRSYMGDYRQLALRVRRCSGAPIVLGGSGFTIFPGEAMELLEADYGIVGEGERLEALLEALAAGLDPAGLPGVVTRSGADAGPPLPAPEPWPQSVRRRFDARAGHVDFYLRNGGMLNLQTKRGCPFRCVYCTYPRIEGRRLRHAPVDEVAATALRLQEAGARYLFITDSAFNADVGHSLEVARAFREHGLTIPWGGFFAPVALPEGYFETMAACGLRHVEFGTESLTDGVLKAYGKPFRRSEVLAAHRAARAAGLHVAHYLLFGGPGETEETFADTLAQIETLERTVLFLFGGMRIYPNTPLHELAVREGQIAAGANIVEPVFYQPAGITLPAIAQALAKRARGRDNWVEASGGDAATAILQRMHQRGRSGPLWEHLVR